MHDGVKGRIEYSIIIFVSFFLICRNSCSAQSNLTERIVGGNNASIKDYPSYVAIFNIKYNTRQLICGGTYIHALWILTAEHCLMDVQLEIPRRVEDVLVAMGLTWLYDAGQSRKPVEFVRHPRGHCVFLKKICDIGLIRINKAFKIDAYVNLASLVDKYPFSKKVVVVGYGAVSASSFTAHSFFQCVHLTILSITKDTIFCRDSTPKGSCYGDSGGPMYSRENGMLVGITSSGVCRDGIGLYVNVFVYRPWIFKALNINGSGRFSAGISLFICVYLIFILDYCIK